MWKFRGWLCVVLEEICKVYIYVGYFGEWYGFNCVDLDGVILGFCVEGLVVVKELVFFYKVL